jgi:thioredoxin-related protein
MLRKLVFMMIVVFIMIPGIGFCETIDWKQYNEGMSLAKKENKKVFLHFRTDWCGYCKKMNQTTFQDSSVIELLNKYFVSIKVDGDRQKSIVKEYKVTGYPDSRLFDEKGKQVHKLPGYVDQLAFLFFLEYIQTDSYKTMDPMEYYKTK